MDEPRKDSSTSTVVTAFVIGAVVGGAIGFLLGRATVIDKGEVPCPPCNIVKQNDGGRQVCRLIGQIADDWSGGPITLASEMLPPGATSPTYTQSSCVDIVVNCAEAAKPSLRFMTVPTPAGLAQPVDNPYCVGPGCATGTSETCH